MATAINKKNMSAPVQKHLHEGDMESVNSNVDDESLHNDSHDSTSHDSNRNSSGPGDGSSESEKLELAKKETAAVLRLRLVVFLVLLLAAVAVSLIVYFITSGSEKDAYVSQFDGAAKKIQEAFVGIVEDKLSAINALGVAIIAHGRDHDSQNWPFVTLSSFAERASTACKTSGVLYVHINPEVKPEQRDEWERFSAESPDAAWIDDTMYYQDLQGISFVHETPPPGSHFNRTAPWPIWYYDDNDEQFRDDTEGPFFPTWQQYPVVYMGLESNENILANKDGLNTGAGITYSSDSVAISQLITTAPGGINSELPPTAFFALMVSFKAGEPTEYQGDPISRVYFPIYDDFGDNRKPVAIMLAAIRWADYFQDILPATQEDIVVVLQDSCGGQFTYIIQGDTVVPLGQGDLHDEKYNDMKQSADFMSVENITDGTNKGLPYNREFCPISLDIYPTHAFYKQYNTDTPVIMTVAVAIVFLFTAVMFVVYDRLVERRQALVMLKAKQTNDIVTSLFPENVRERLLEQGLNPNKKDGTFMAPNRRLKGYLDGQDDEIDTTPIADLFPHCTVLFADIAGFTAWSSTRDPAQVFILLQTVYQAFDKIAKRRKVFKVETIGDSYVAVTGLPEPQPTHAVIMARFAGECRLKMNELTARLENTLGPDTGDLTMRFGLHSGPVTAGVLRGERARFQLFGDTVNTAARMESTGIRNKIQVSESTYFLLIEAGKNQWVKPRSDAVIAKGKGSLRTYWLDPKAKSGSSTAGSSVSGAESSETSSHVNLPNAQVPPQITSLRQQKSAEAAMKHERLVNWIVDMLHEHIRKVVAMRKPKSRSKSFKAVFTPNPNQTSLDEVAEVIYLPRFCEKNFAEAQNANDIDIGDDARAQLKEYVSTIASMYRDNPFHNFEHACHVSMATNKFLKRIVAPDIALEKAKMGDIASKLHEYTHGINSDPLTLLAIVFSALIHDVDHRGVSNAQLADEDKELGEKYHGKSVAEQHSLDLSWDILMDERFATLRNAIFADDEDLKRFRQVLVNVVLATDIFDRELNDLRKKRWGKAFSQEGLTDEENNDLRATIVIEHIIQASDVSHTMQHWHIYRKWNKRLFTEMYVAYKQGRMAKDPSTFWYKGEVGFFDNYVIPLAKKLKDCNVFGVSSDECLNYATMNRNEWQEKGAQIVEEMMQELAFTEGTTIPENIVGETEAESSDDASA